MKKVLFFLFTLCCLYSIISAADVNLGTFTGGLTFTISNNFGFLNRANVSVQASTVSTSTQAYQDLANGVYDLVFGSTDNALTRYYNFPGYNQSINLIGVTGENALQIIAGGADINTWEDFKNKTFVVDSPTSGLVFALRRALAIRNLYAERNDYFFLPVGVSLQRFQAIYNGYATVNGVNVTVSGGVLSVPYAANILADPNFYQGRVKAIGIVTNEVLPLAASSWASRPDVTQNPVKAEFLARFLAAQILARKFLAQAQNKADVVSILQTQNSTQFAPAIELIYNAAIDPVIGELDTTLVFNEVGLKNAIFLKETFGGAPYNDTDYNNAFVYGPGQLIDYSIVNAAQQKVRAILAEFSVTNLAGLSACGYNKDKFVYFTINQFTAAVKNNTVGTCTTYAGGEISATFVNCTSDIWAPNAFCLYDAPSDSLKVAVFTKPNANNTRRYTAAVRVSDACGTTIVVNRIVDVYTQNPPAGCTTVC